MKIEDYCETSVELLDGKVRCYFAETYSSQNVYIPGVPSSFVLDINCKEIVEVVLFGDYLNDFFLSGCWAIEKMRLWVLSSSSKEVLCELFGFRDDEIGIIPRDSLFNISTQTVDEVDLNGVINLVYGGRISEVKNSLFLLSVYAQLEKLGNYRLHFYGSFDSQRIHDRPDRSSFEEYFCKYFRNKKWINKPFLHGMKLYDEWPDKYLTNKIFIFVPGIKEKNPPISGSESLMEMVDFLVTNGHDLRLKIVDLSFIKKYMVDSSKASRGIIIQKAGKILSL